MRVVGLGNRMYGNDEFGTYLIRPLIRCTNLGCFIVFVVFITLYPASPRGYDSMIKSGESIRDM